MKKVSLSVLPLLPASHEDIDKPGVRKKVIFSSDNFPNKVEMKMINWAILPVGSKFKTHYHEDMDEIFLIIDGKAEMRVGKDTQIVQTGDNVIVPKSNEHQMKNIGEVPVIYYVVGLSEGKGGKTIVTEQ